MGQILGQEPAQKRVLLAIRGPPILGSCYRGSGSGGWPSDRADRVGLIWEDHDRPTAVRSAAPWPSRGHEKWPPSCGNPLEILII